MAKPIRYSVAIVLKNPIHPDKFLVVRRPDDDPDLRSSWGLPAVTLAKNELPEDGARRACQEKLGCMGAPGRLLGLMYQKRNSYDLFLMDIEMTLTGGTRPDVSKANTTHTQYVAQKWTTDPNTLMPSAREGSCCASIFLTDRGLLDRAEWINSLEGSDLVA